MWNFLSPPSAEKRSQITVSVAVTRNGTGKVIIAIPNGVALRGRIDDGTNSVKVAIGADEMDGHMAILPAEPEGAGNSFPVTRLKHCIVVKLAPLPGMSLRKAAASVDYSLSRIDEVAAAITFKMPDFLLDAHSDKARDAAIERSADDKPASLEMQGNTLIMGARRVTATKMEAEILKLLVDNFGKPVSRDAVHSSLYCADPNGGADPKILDVMMTKIRDRIAKAGMPLLIVTERGFGWQMRRAIG